jgi:endoglucanase
VGELRTPEGHAEAAALQRSSGQRSRAALTLPVALAFLLLASCDTGEPPRLKAGLWQDYAQRFVRNGRVVDTGNGGISHSEGQGYGMLLAVAARDRASVDALWAWTARVLQRPDQLLSWRYRPCASADASCVDDANNASDGDILVAWALLRAHDIWRDDAYRTAARALLDAIAAHLVVSWRDHRVLLPGETGFRHGDALTVNLSYWVFPALARFAHEDPEGPWQALIDSGRFLVEQARFGAAQLPPDWLQLDVEGWRISPRFPARYGFDACRIPLYAHWAGLEPDGGWQALYRLWQRESVPAWVDLDSDSSADFSWNRGMAAVADLLRAPGQGHSALPVPGAEDDYYSASLLLLSHLAAAEQRQ